MKRLRQTNHMRDGRENPVRTRRGEREKREEGELVIELRCLVSMPPF